MTIIKYWILPNYRKSLNRGCQVLISQLYPLDSNWRTRFRRDEGGIYEDVGLRSAAGEAVSRGAHRQREPDFRVSSVEWWNDLAREFI